jgi:hypothetical protein
MRVRMDIADDCVLGASHDTAPLHTQHCQFVNFWQKSAPYSPDLSPCDFYLFPKLKLRIKGYDFRHLTVFRML